MNQSWIFWLTYLIGIENKAAVMRIDYFASSAENYKFSFSRINCHLVCTKPI